MPRTFLRLAAAALLALFMPGCGGEGPTPPPPATPTASLAIGSAAATIAAGASTQVAVTLTRGGGFAGAVTVGATALPAGVTASTETIAAGATTATLTLTATGSVTPVSAAAVSITGTGSGVTIAPQALALSVTPPAGASIALSAAAGSVPAGSSATVVVTLTRTGGYTGDIVIAAASLPTGVTSASQTISGAATSATLTIATTGSAAAATTPISITGAGTGVTIAPQAYALTVTAPIAQIVQIGGDVTSTDPSFGGHPIVLSADGTRMAVSAKFTTNGTARVYQRTGNVWTQLGADVIGTGVGTRASTGLAINAAGTRIAVGETASSLTNRGLIRVFDWDGTSWTQVGATIDGTINSGSLGRTVALSASGNRLVAAGYDGFTERGQIRVFDLVGTTWTQVGATLVAGNGFGYNVDVSSDGSTIAASQLFLSRVGAVQVLRLSGATWTQVGNLLTDSLTSITQDQGFGQGLSLSGNGSRIAVGAPRNKEAGLIVGSADGPGKVRVYDLVGNTWTQVGNAVLGTAIAGRNPDAFGFTLALSDDGTRFAATVSGNSEAKVYSVVNGTWVQTGATVSAAAGEIIFDGLALAADGKTLALGYRRPQLTWVRAFSITP
jgi:hypothetical protein